MSGLIVNPGGIWLMVESVDMRCGIDGLSLLVKQRLQQSPCSGSAFVFCNRAGNRIKVLLWDSAGVWLCQRRLHQGRFVWQRSGEGGHHPDASSMGMVDHGGRLASFKRNNLRQEI